MWFAPQLPASAPTSLEELAEYLRDGTIWDGATTKHGELDWTSLPTFGGNEPDDMQGVWSWDVHRLLVGTCTGDLEIVYREDYVTVAEILGLLSNADVARDVEQAAICRRALGLPADAPASELSVVDARRECARVIWAARAMENQS